MRKKGKDTRKRSAALPIMIYLQDSGNTVETYLISFLSSLSTAVLSILDTETNRFFDRSQQMYDAALLIQHALRPLFESETNHKRH